MIENHWKHEQRVPKLYYETTAIMSYVNPSVK